MGFNLGDVPDIIGLTPNIPYAGNTNADGLQESHLVGTDFLKTTLKDLVALLDPTGTLISADGAWNEQRGRFPLEFGDTPLNRNVNYYCVTVH